MMIIIIIASIIALIWLLDKMISVKNVISEVQYPKDLSRLKIDPDKPDVLSNVTYLPPTTKNEDSNVYLLVSGNPGNPWFYVDFMKQLQHSFGGNVHIYAIGHAYHASSIDIDSYDHFNKLVGEKHNERPEEANVPKIDAHRTPSRPVDLEKTPTWKNPADLQKYIIKEQEGITGVGWSAESVVFNLRQQVAQKMSLLVKLREKHPKSKIIIGGHSMGSYCWYEMLRAIERCYVYKNYGKDGLEAWDSEQGKLKVEDVENDQIPIHPLPNPPSIIANFAPKISRILHSTSELELWMDGLAINVPKANPFENLASLLPKGSQEFQTAFAAHINSQVTQHALSPILQFHGLLPTIIHIAQTPNGHAMTWLMFQEGLMNFLAKCIARVPGFIKRVLVNLSAPFYKYPDVNTAIGFILTQQGINNILELSRDEMENIRSLDANMFQRHAEKIWLYMSDADEWAPKWQREYYQALNLYWKKNGMKEMAVHVDTDGVQHAFCFGGNQALSKHLTQFVSQRHPEFAK